MISSLVSDVVTSPEALPSGNEFARLIQSLPDPMKIELGPLLFVIALLTLLCLFLKHVFFKPLTSLMDEREESIRLGSALKTKAEAEIQSRQTAYASRLNTLRAEASVRYKTLTAAATTERTQIIENTRQKAQATREAALAELKAAQEAAKGSLMAQVETLSEAMVQQLLKQA